jgi:hypothetical protein
MEAADVRNPRSGMIGEVRVKSVQTRDHQEYAGFRQRDGPTRESVRRKRGLVPSAPVDRR